MRLREQSVNDRFPSSFARAKADAAIDDLPEQAPMTEYVDTWLRVYRENGGIVTKARRK